MRGKNYVSTIEKLLLEYMLLNEFEIKILKNKSAQQQQQMQHKYGHHHFRSNTLIEIK